MSSSPQFVGDLTDDSSLSRFLNENMVQSLTSPTSAAMATSFSSADKQSAMSDEKLDSFLSLLWDKQTKEERPVGGIKRKASDEGIVGSTDSVDAELHVGGANSAGNKPSQRNVLLAKLLSKRAATETVVNPRAISLTSLPNPYLPVPHTTPTPQDNTGVQSAELPKMSSGPAQKPTAWDNPRTDPNSPFPGNTKDNPGLGMPNSMSTNPNLNANLADALASSAGGSSHLMEALGGMTAMTDSMPMSASSSASVSSTTGPRSLRPCSSADPLLSDILQEASELQNDINMRHMGTGGATDSDSSVPEDMFYQIEQVMKSIPLPDLENFLGPFGSSDSGQQQGEPPAQQFHRPVDINEQMAINAIQQQLMSAETSPHGGSTVAMQQIGVNTQLSPHAMLGSASGAMTSPMTSPQGPIDPQQSIANMEQQLRQQLQGAAHSPHQQLHGAHSPHQQLHGAHSPHQQLQGAHSPHGAVPPQGFTSRPNMLPSHGARFVQPHGKCLYFWGTYFRLIVTR